MERGPMECQGRQLRPRLSTECQRLHTGKILVIQNWLAYFLDSPVLKELFDVHSSVVVAQLSQRSILSSAKLATLCRF